MTEPTAQPEEKKKRKGAALLYGLPGLAVQLHWVLLNLLYRTSPG